MSIKHVVSVSGGKDSLATLLIAMSRFGRANVIAIFCDTGNEHQETYAYLDYLEQKLGIRIHRLKTDFSERMEIHRMRLLAIANGADDYKPSAKFPWTPERAARAAEMMHPTGNPFLDLCMLKGMFPSHGRQFCTEELKRNPAVEFQLDLIEAGHTVVSWQGVRRDESRRRANVPKFERLDKAMYVYRPIADWTANDVFDYCGKHGVSPNPLYLQGMGRVGCMPCVNVGKTELSAIARRFPDQIERIEKWEALVNEVSRSGRASFLYSGGWENIWQRVEWSKTTRGGRQYDLLYDQDDSNTCSSAYGLCE